MTIITKSKSKLDSVVIDVELLLISVVQGLAIQALVEAAIIPIQELQFEYWPYFLTAFFFILVYWAQAILHTLTFIKWPLDIGHSFLYYLTAIVEFLAFYQITDPFRWFVFTSALMLSIIFLYIFDLWLLKNRRDRFCATKEGNDLYNHALRGQTFELYFFVPAAVVFNILAAATIYYYPVIFIDNGYHLWLIGAQGLFTLGFLIRSIWQFKKRSELITLYEERDAA